MVWGAVDRICAKNNIAPLSDRYLDLIGYAEALRGNMRIGYFDAARAIAILTVVWVHSWDFYVIPSSLTQTGPGWFAFQVGHVIGRLGVPVFLMITGALMLDREYDDIAGFLRTKLPRFAVVLVVAAFFYSFLARILNGTSLHRIVPKFLNGEPIGSGHLWYLYMLIGLYAAIPFLARAVSKLTKQELALIIAAALLLFTVPWTLRISGANISYVISSGFPFGSYTLYAVLGLWLHKYNALRPIAIPYRMILLVIAILFACAAKYYLDYAPNQAMPIDGIVWYDSLLIVIPSIILFSIIRDLYKNVELSRLILVLSASSFSIYLWHLIPLYFLNTYFSELAPKPLLMLLAMIGGLSFGVFAYLLLKNTRFKIFVG